MSVMASIMGSILLPLYILFWVFMIFMIIRLIMGFRARQKRMDQNLIEVTKQLTEIKEILKKESLSKGSMNE